MHYEYYRTLPLIGGVAGGLLSPANEDWRWRLQSGNGVIIASGQGYTNKKDCLHAIDLMKATTLATPVKLVAS